jgi:hypothetical protein
MNTRNLVAASPTKEKEVLIQAMYPLSTLALTCKRAVYVGLGLLLIGRPVKVKNWLDHSITSWPAVILFLVLLLLLLAILLNYNYLFSRKATLQIDASLSLQDQQGTQWTVPLEEVEALVIQHSKKSGGVVLDIRSQQISMRVLLCEQWPLYTFTKRGYRATMQKIQEAFQHYPVFQEKSTIQEVLYID